MAAIGLREKEGADPARGSAALLGVRKQARHKRLCVMDVNLNKQAEDAHGAALQDLGVIMRRNLHIEEGGGDLGALLALLQDQRLPFNYAFPGLAGKLLLATNPGAEPAVVRDALAACAQAAELAGPLAKNLPLVGVVAAAAAVGLGRLLFHNLTALPEAERPPEHAATKELLGVMVRKLAQAARPHVLHSVKRLLGLQRIMQSKLMRRLKESVASHEMYGSFDGRYDIADPGQSLGPASEGALSDLTNHCWSTLVGHSLEILPALLPELGGIADAIAGLRAGGTVLELEDLAYAGQLLLVNLDVSLETIFAEAAALEIFGSKEWDAMRGGFKASFLVPAAHATLTISALGSPGALSAAKALAGDAGVAAVQAEPRSGSQSRRSPGSPPGSAGAAAFAGAEDSPLGHEGLPGPQRRQAAGQQEALRLFGEQGELVTRLLQQLGQRDRQLEEKQRRVEEAERQLVDLRALHAAEVETQRRRCTALAARVRELEEQAEGSPHAAAPASPQRLRAARAGASAGAAAQPTTEAMVAPFNRRDASRALATLTKSEAWRSGLTSLLVGTRILELWMDPVKAVSDSWAHAGACVALIAILPSRHEEDLDQCAIACSRPTSGGRIAKVLSLVDARPESVRRLAEAVQSVMDTQPPQPAPQPRSPAAAAAAGSEAPTVWVYSHAITLGGKQEARLTPFTFSWTGKQLLNAQAVQGAEQVVLEPLRLPKCLLSGRLLWYDHDHQHAVRMQCLLPPTAGTEGEGGKGDTRGRQEPAPDGSQGLT